jgi:hypothetical protein
MLLALFLIILAISLLLIGFGEYTKEGIYSLGGLLFLFLLGLTVLLPGNLTIPNGETVNLSYACGCCNNHEFILQDTYYFYCYGTPHNCDYYDGNPIECLEMGCAYDYNTSLCNGYPTPCENYTEFPPCLNAGCEYNYQQGGTCPNGTEKVVTSETHTTTQEPFNDTMSHIMGVWLTLIAIFGFAIKLGQIRAGFKNE